MVVQTTEDAIKEEIRSWSKEALEQVNPSFANLPPCPYAENAWIEDKVGIGFKMSPSFQDLTTILSTWDDKNDLVILVDLHFIQDREKFYQHIDGLNEGIAQGIFIEQDIWLMAFHPDDEPSEMAYAHEDFISIVDVPYAMIFIQRLSKLHEAAEKLKKTGYYKEYEQQFGLMDMLRVRETYYRRLKDG
jgi:hypothetical protein